MPYADIADLPKGVRGHLPADAQEIWLHTFNAVYEDTGGDDDKARRAAWANVKREFVKGAGDMWTRK
jgi:cation transport regulator ChaB